MRGDLRVAEQLLGAAAGAGGHADARVTASSPLPTGKGVRSASSRRSAISFAPAPSESSSATTMNSSPPSRPRASMSLTSPSSRAATPRSSSSPAPCPSVSLMTVKLSRFTCSAATGLPLRRARLSICSVRSRISVRLARPSAGRGVTRNSSCSPRLSSSASWRMRSLSKTSHMRTSVTSRVPAPSQARAGARGR